MVLDPIALTQELVRLPSVSSSDGQQAVLSFLGEHLRHEGFVVKLDGGTSPQFLLATSSTVRESPVLLFVCHVDTVPVGDLSEWTRDPFAGEISDGRIWGRGSSDMKSGLAASMVALLEAGAAGPSAALLLTTDEEIGCLGAAAARYALEPLNVQAIVVPESTDNLVALGHRGALWLRLAAQGVAAHGGTPELGKSALLSLAGSLIDIDARFPRRAGGAGLGSTTINFGTMSAGTAPNIVADRASAIVDIRFSGRDEPVSLLEWFAQNEPELVVESLLEIGPLSTPAGSAWIKSLSAEIAEPASANYFTDTAVLAPMFPRVPVAIWGPGQGHLAHARDESVPVRQIRDAVAMYATTLTAWPSISTQLGE